MGIFLGKLDQNKQQKRESLLNAAFNLFTTKGISKTSISDIALTAGVAKGTFYLYFKDKHDIRNKLISHKSSQVFKNSVVALENYLSKKTEISIDNKIIFVIDNIINQLSENKPLLSFISKNLSWGIFKTALISPENGYDINFKDVYLEIINNSEVKLKDPEIMLFMIIELVGSSCYSTILYSQPTTIEQLKPYLYSAIKNIINSHKTGN